MAEDASQEVFIQLWKKLLILMGKANFPRGYTALWQTLPLLCTTKKGGCSGCWKTTAFADANEENSTDVDLEALVIRLQAAK